MKHYNLLLLCGLVLTLAGCGTNTTKNNSKAGAADAIFFGGDILTMIGDSVQYAEALGVKDGKIIFVGNKVDGFKMQGDSTAMIDLQGKTMLPGFIDPHSHFINSLSLSTQVNCSAPPVGPGKSVEAIIAAIKEFSTKRNIPKGEVIVAWGYDDTKMPNGRLLNRDDLDEAFPDNPVVMIHTTMHGCVLNSSAMKKYGITNGMKTPEGGIIVRKPGTDEPYGLIMETAYIPVISNMPKPSRQEMVERLKTGQMIYAEEGITTAQEGATHKTDLDILALGAKENKLFIDVISYPFITDARAITEEHPFSTFGSYNNHLKIGGVKITADGSPQARTAFFSTPYLTGGPSGQKKWIGEPTFSQDSLNAYVKWLYENKIQFICHGNGDSAIGMILKAHEYACKTLSQPLDADRRTTVIHSQFVRKDQLDKYKTYNIIPSFFTEHSYFFSQEHIKNRGIKQASFLSPINSAYKLGLQPTNHTDFVVLPLNQMMTVWTAVNRLTPDGKVLGPEERITAYQALKCITINAAHQYSEENSKGTLKSGNIADFVILDKNPVKVDPLVIKDIIVLETIKDGKTIYKK